MLRNVLLPSIAIKRTITAAPAVSTGIEHAEKFKQLGKSQSTKPEEYLCAEYLNFNKYSYYNTEKAMTPSRAPQPSNKRPDVAPQVKQQ